MTTVEEVDQLLSCGICQVTMFKNSSCMICVVVPAPERDMIVGNDPSSWQHDFDRDFGENLHKNTTTI